MTIPLLDLSRVHAPILAQMQQAAADVIADGRYIMGPAVKEFEAAAANWLGAAHAIGVSNGTDALRVTLDVLGQLRGRGRVVTTPFTFIATAEAIVTARHEPCFVDVDSDTAQLDVNALHEVPDDVVGVVPVHLFGQCVPMDSLLEWSRGRNAWVVEDAAQSFGATWGDRQSGTLGTAGCFSFFPSKNLGGAGDGGLIVTDDDETARFVRAARVHGVLSRKYHTDFLAGNYRLDTLQAALLNVKLPHVADWNRRRAEVASRYETLFAQAGLSQSGAIRPLARVPGSSHVYHQYVVRARRRDDLMAHLREAGIATAVYYPVPLHVQPAFAWLGLRPEAFPNAMALASQALALPVFPGLTPAEQEIVVGRMADFYRSGKS